MTQRSWRQAWWVAAAALMLGGCEKSGEQAGKDIGRQIDRAVEQGREKAGDLSEDLRQGWGRARAGVESLGLRGRVYARLHWDKSLSEARIDIDADEEGMVTLRGSVPTAAAKARAADLARETTGVERVVDELNVEPAVETR